MLKRAKKTNSLLKTIVFIFFSSGLLLLILNLIFPKNSWFKKTVVINPVIKNVDIDRSKIGELLLDSGIPFFSISFVQNYFDIELKDAGKVYVSSTKDLGIQISSLQSILKQLTINGKGFKLIDFRFDKPVIVMYE